MRSDYKENKQRESKTEEEYQTEASKTDDKRALQAKPKKRHPKFQKHEPRNEDEGQGS